MHHPLGITRGWPQPFLYNLRVAAQNLFQRICIGIGHALWISVLKRDHPNRWSSTRSTKVNLFRAIISRPLCGASLVTPHPGIRPHSYSTVWPVQISYAIGKPAFTRGPGKASSGKSPADLFFEVKVAGCVAPTTRGANFWGRLFLLVSIDSETGRPAPR